ncbi:hypothetical protein EUGRSUZ_F01162, partial [Eucalyptus grandis]
AGIIEDPFGVLNSWNSSIGFCQWYGVTCGRRHRRVTVLELSSQGLSGSISPHVGNLSFLRKMWLPTNNLGHEIPSQVGQLRCLHFLVLENNSLIGEIPKNISGCRNLLALGLGNNELIGEIPVELGSLNKLWLIDLDCNNLTGSLPSSIGNLSSLEFFSLNRNNLGGSIPQGLGHLKNLQFIGLSFNILLGTIPSSLFNLSSLIVFQVGYNRIDGTLPAGMGLKLPDLEVFVVAQNQLEGPIPPSILNCTKLERLLISANRFSGKVPSLENLYKLNWLSLHKNKFGRGHLEDLSFICSLTNSTELEVVDIGSNKFGGALPNCLGNLSTNMKALVANLNKIFGEFPEEIGNLFSGVIPSNLGNLQNVKELYLSFNNLGGTIPSSLGNLTKMIHLTLERNNFHGQIPSHLSNYRSLILLDLSDNNRNYLTGILPTEVGNLRALTMLDISDNLLVGEIPSSLGDCTSLTSLRMEGNFFHGSIPQSIRSLGGIGEIDISRNNLSGQIPELLAVFQSLQLLNLSYNKFEGMLPCEGVFKNAIGTSIVGNDELCGGLPEFHLPNCIFKSHKSRNINIVMVVASVISGVVGMALITAFIYLCWVKKNVNEPISSSMDDSHLNLSYGTLLKATKGFSLANLVGVGSFGSVYKGILMDNGTVVAVKVLHLVRHGALKSFTIECEALKNVKHRNLLKILTVCSRSDYQGNDFKALVYEFMDNGSLEQWLHSYATSSHENMLPKKLNFIWRINIAIDVASALNYLHHQCHIPIVHCDLKPSNILLDAEMVAHVGDFGLAKFLLESSLDTIDNQMSSVGLRGTMGYAPPEYAMGCDVSREGDVYSFGILLLEIFTGLSPTDNKFRDNLTLHSFVAEALPTRVLEIMDSFMLQERDSHLGPYSCRLPERRMSINEVVNQLHRIRKKLFALGL